jgi:hypothetical protein
MNRVEPVTNAVVTAKALQQFADQLPAQIDQRAADIAGAILTNATPPSTRQQSPRSPPRSPHKSPRTSPTHRSHSAE